MIDRLLDGGLGVAHAPQPRQTEALEAAVRENAVVCVVLARAPQLGLASWYLGAGGGDPDRV